MWKGSQQPTGKQWRHWHSRPEGYGKMMIPVPVKRGWRLMGPWWGPSRRHTCHAHSSPLSMSFSFSTDDPLPQSQATEAIKCSWYGGKCSFSSNGSQSMELVLRQFSSAAQSCPTLCTPWTAAHQASLSITNSQSLLKLMSIELVMPPNHLNLCCPLLLPLSIFPSMRAFSNESALHIRWTKYWSFSFNISSSNEYSGLISFRMDWLDLLAVQGTLKNFLQHHS